MDIKETDLAWLAGIIDGEGSIGASKSKSSTGKDAYSIQLQIENTNLPMMEKFVNITEKLGAHRRLKTSVKNINKNPKWKNSYRYNITKQSEVKAILGAIRPYLVAKEPQANLILEWIEHRQKMPRHAKGYKMPHDKRIIDIYKELRQLNSRGN